MIYKLQLVRKTKFPLYVENVKAGAFGDGSENAKQCGGAKHSHFIAVYFPTLREPLAA